MVTINSIRAKWTPRAAVAPGVNTEKGLGCWQSWDSRSTKK